MLPSEEISAAQPFIFTATMEDGVETRTTFNSADRRIFWEAGDGANINGHYFTAQNAGASTTFIGYATEEVRPTFVASPSSGFQGQEPKFLVDDAGTSTKWCANNSDHKGGDAWIIIVSTDASYQLQSIKLWNGGDTKDFPGRRWKNFTVSGSASASGPWEDIKSFQDLDLAANNSGLAGTLNVDATALYQYYKIDISAIMSGDVMQMSDMKFDIVDKSKPLNIPSPYTAYFPETLYNNGKPTLPSSVSETWAEDRFNMPMYAYSTTKNLQFKNLCGMLKVVVKNNQLASVRNINVSSMNCATSGAFTVKDNKAVLTSPSAIANTLTINYTEAVPTSSEGTVFYVPIPAQTYRDLKISVGGSSGLPKIMTTKKDKDIVVERNKIYTIDFAGSELPVPAGALPGQYTINQQGQKVYFSQGNMYYNGTAYKIESNQYAFQSNWNKSHVSHFFWTRTGEEARSKEYPTPTPYASDVFFTNNAEKFDAIDGVKYRTPSSVEWLYLFGSSRMTFGKPSYSNALNGIEIGGKSYSGLFLYPDNYGGDVVSSSMSWADIKAAGIVFLPVIGYRRWDSSSFYGGFYYWSSSPAGNAEHAQTLEFDYSSQSPVIDSSRRDGGKAVRLITDVPAE